MMISTSTLREYLILFAQYQTSTSAAQQCSGSRPLDSCEALEHNQFLISSVFFSVLPLRSYNFVFSSTLNVGRDLFQYLQIFHCIHLSGCWIIVIRVQSHLLTYRFTRYLSAASGCMKLSTSNSSHHQLAAAYWPRMGKPRPNEDSKFEFKCDNWK